MSDNNATVILISDDVKLREVVLRAKPTASVLHCISAVQARNEELPAAGHFWIDLEAADQPIDGPWKRRVYFYTSINASHWRLPPGTFLPKSSASAVIDTLWAEAREVDLGAPSNPANTEIDSNPVIPAWILEFDGLDLRELCRKCVDVLPARLGYSAAAVYLHDAARNSLTLADTNVQNNIELSIPTDAGGGHVLAEVVKSNRVLVSDDLANLCVERDWTCPASVTQAHNQAAAIMPLVLNDRISGVVLLTGPRTPPSFRHGDATLERLARFLARRLAYARRYMRARREARVDRLTGLFNDRWMTESLEREIRRAQRFNSPLSLIMIDLDGLKLVNDRLGHLAGDALIRHVANKISSALRQIDSAARIGGDEFVVLLPSTTADGAKRVADRIHQAIRSDAPVINGKLLPVSASIGLAEWEDSWDARRLREAADKAMYVAKSASRAALQPDPRKAAVGSVQTTRLAPDGAIV